MVDVKLKLFYINICKHWTVYNQMGSDMFMNFIFKMCWEIIFVVNLISFQTTFVQAFTIVVDSCKFSILVLYILWDDWPIFMISASNEQLQ